MKRALVALAFCGCMSFSTAPGLKMRKAPADVPFCAGGLPVENDTEWTYEFPQRDVEACSSFLRKYPDLNSVYDWNGEIVLVLTFNEQGAVRDVCVTSGDFGNVPEYVSCLGRVAREAREQAAGKRTWRVRYFYE